jgi:hypothetical protein
MSRNMLHKKHLADFTQWLEDKDYPIRPGKGDWQVLQVFIGGNWYAVYERLFMPEHLTAAGNKLEKLVRRFYDEHKEKENV